uniref:NADH dehydrogenase subunit 4 n=1 Tax=Varanus rudicollis TaxID=169851 RepID=UPI0021824167|nr:NADH dehydrogenase subunit 4 [Varanus rudicollis]BDP99527.1 NADH dehydrogenase subunit 4 [Varanus rudicollis]
MLKTLLSTILLIPTIMLTKPKFLFTSFTSLSTIIATISLIWLKPPLTSKMTFLNPFMSIDSTSAPLLILSCWLLPIMAMASQNHLKHEPTVRKRMFLITITTLQTFLLMTFTTNNLILFYISFEATLIPTLIVITRWGSQAERLKPGTYFMFYTLANSLPLLISILYLNSSSLTLLFPEILPHPLQPTKTLNQTFLWFGCLMAFMVKMPLYGFHLWLPKAHVEAPIAGSMVLAAILLKMGGYGMIRILPALTPLTPSLMFPLLTMAIWGITMTSLTCLRQTDLKSLIAYSSVSHMGLVISAVLTQTSLGLTGSMLLMIAHGLTSSMLFCLANTNYEQTQTRTLLITRGLHIILPLMTLWWLYASFANMALPPSINLMGELLIITSLFSWSPLTIILTGTGTLLTASYTLYMFLTTQKSKLPPNIILSPSHTREHLLMALHLIPLILLTSKPELIMSS